ncbi:MAG: hypothetical protein D6820_07065 [Lentisphaerae bacterium]|nr:MAG: hypothetical protein D6820_07065 [Lentisphaerota bacterium]
MQLVKRVFLIIEHLARQHEGSGFQELARDLALPPPSLSRLLRALCEAGIVTKDEQTGRYKPGERLATLVQQLGGERKPEDQLIPVVEGVATRTQCSAAYFELIPGSLVLLAKADVPDSFRYIDRYACSPHVLQHAFGRTILAFQPAHLRESWIAAFQRDPDDGFHAILKNVRNQGYYAGIDGCNRLLWRLVIPTGRCGIMGPGALGITSLDRHPPAAQVSDWLNILRGARQLIERIFASGIAVRELPQDPHCDDKPFFDNQENDKELNS